MENKQTAVEWLIEQLKDYDFADIKDNEYYIIKIPTWILKEKEIQALEMEKKQIIKFLEIIIWYDEKSDVRPDAEIYNWFEQYYNKIYKSE